MESSTIQALLRNISKAENSLEIVLKTKMLLKKMKLVSSICCNGVCLTVTKINKNLISLFIYPKKLLIKPIFNM